MVYCTKCGTENKEDAQYCVKCGAPLFGERRERPEKHEKEEREEREMCFGPTLSTYWGVILGIILVIAGSFFLLQQSGLIPKAVEIWPLFAIIFGILIIIGVFYRPRR